MCQIVAPSDRGFGVTSGQGQPGDTEGWMWLLALSGAGRRKEPEASPRRWQGEMPPLLPPSRPPAEPTACPLPLYQTPSLYSYCSHLRPTSFRLCSLLLIFFPEGGFAAGGRDGQGATSEFYDMAFCSLACSIQFGAQCPSSVACRDLLSR